MTTNTQPNWKLIANLGDVNPIEYGGYFVYEDTTGVYAPEGELLQYNDDRNEWTIYRFPLDKCTLTNSVLSDNKFHPEYPAWFARKLDNVGDYIMSATGDQMRQWLCGDNLCERAMAYEAIGSYHGFENLDSYPLTFTERAEVEARYKDEVAPTPPKQIA